MEGVIDPWHKFPPDDMPHHAVWEYVGSEIEMEIDFVNIVTSMDFEIDERNKRNAEFGAPSTASKKEAFDAMEKSAQATVLRGKAIAKRERDATKRLEKKLAADAESERQGVKIDAGTTGPDTADLEAMAAAMGKGIKRGGGVEGIKDLDRNVGLAYSAELDGCDESEFGNTWWRGIGARSCTRYVLHFPNPTTVAHTRLTLVFY